MLPALRPALIVLCVTALACSSGPDHEAPLPDGGYQMLSGCSKYNLSALLDGCALAPSYDYSFAVCFGGQGPTGRFKPGAPPTGLMPPATDPSGLNYSVDVCDADGESSFMNCAAPICQKVQAYAGASSAYEPPIIEEDLASACYSGNRVAGEDQTCATNCMNAAQTCMAACPTDTWDNCATCSNACSTKWRSCDNACPRDTASCDNGKKDGDETDVDCGGSQCMASCETGQHCKVAADCVNGVCTNGTCPAPTCTDGFKNGFEVDVDCGGIDCPACKATQHCYAGSDCTSGNCVAASFGMAGTCG